MRTSSHVRGGADHLREEFAELEATLADPAVHADLARPARSVGATPS